LLWARGIEGVIIAPLGDRIFISHETSLSFDWQRFCNVQIGATLTNPALHLVRHNHFFGMTLCLEQLEALGYRRIGLALSKVGDLRSHHLWCSSYSHWRALRGMTQQLPYLIFDAELDTRKLAHWLKHYRIEAVVAMDTVPLNVIRSLHLSVPGDIGFATLDHNNRDNTISGIDQYAEEIGSSAVNQLVHSIRHGNRGIPSMPNQVLVGGKWIAGQTTRRRRKISPQKQNMMDQPMPTEV
jgi:DNA-binding LacI/PurR family transcriptional regulator